MSMSATQRASTALSSLRRFSLTTSWDFAIIAYALGALGALGHAPFLIGGSPVHVWPATLACLVGFVWLLDGADARAPLRSGFWRGWWLGSGYFLVGLWWVGEAFITRGPEFAPFAPIASLAMGFGLALFWGAAGAVARVLWTHDHRRIAVFAVVLCLFEYLRGFVFTGFPWNLVGHVWPAGGAMSQTAAHIGVWGLTALTVYGFASPAALFSRSGDFVSRIMPLALGFAAMAVCFAAGLGRLSTASDAVVEDVRLRLVQQQIPLEEKFRPGNAFAVLDRYLDATESEGLEDVTHIIWPENAVPAPIYLNETDIALENINATLKRGQVLLSGTTRRDPDDTSGTTFYNSMVGLRFSTAETERARDDIDAKLVEFQYDKVKLVPFGEVTPFRNFWRVLGFGEMLNRQGADFEPGSGPTTVDIPGAPPAAPQICYETIFSGFTPRGAERPQWIVTVSNDSWYGLTAGPWQFLNQTRYRAIEEGLPVVRSVSGGASGVIDAYGRMPKLRQSAFGDDAVLDSDLPAALKPTLYALTGDAGFAILIVLGVLLANWRLPDGGRRQFE